MDLEAQANAVRARLAARLDTLVERKRRLLTPAAELQRHPREALMLGGVVAVMLLAGAGAVAYRMSTREERARRTRWEGWRRLVAHPERAPKARPGFVLGVLERSASAAVVATLAAIAKHVVTKVLDGAPVGAAPPHDLPAALFPPHQRDSVTK